MTKERSNRLAAILIGGTLSMALFRGCAGSPAIDAGYHPGEVQTAWAPQVIETHPWTDGGAGGQQPWSHSGPGGHMASDGRQTGFNDPESGVTVIVDN